MAGKIDPMAIDQWGKPKKNVGGSKNRAIREHCCECNGTRVWTEKTDCVSKYCYLYPFRPGNGPGHYKSKRGGNIASLNKARDKNLTCMGRSSG